MAAPGRPFPFYPTLPTGVSHQQLMAYLSQVSRSLASPPGPRVPLGHGPGMHFNPQAQLQPGQVQDFRHNAAFRHWLQQNRMPIPWMQPTRVTQYKFPPMPRRPPYR